MVDWFFLIGWLIGSFYGVTGLLNDWFFSLILLVDWLIIFIEWRIDWLIDIFHWFYWWINWLCWVASWLIDWLIGSCTGVTWSASWSISSLPTCRPSLVFCCKVNSRHRIIGGSCHKDHFCCNKKFVATKLSFCCDKSACCDKTFVVRKVCLLWQNIFVTTKD